MGRKLSLVIADTQQCSWCGVVGGHDLKCYVPATLANLPNPYDVMKSDKSDKLSLQEHDGQYYEHRLHSR